VKSHSDCLGYSSITLLMSLLKCLYTSVFQQVILECSHRTAKFRHSAIWSRTEANLSSAYIPTIEFTAARSLCTSDNLRSRLTLLFFSLHSLLLRLTQFLFQIFDNHLHVRYSIFPPLFITFPLLSFSLPVVPWPGRGNAGVGVIIRLNTSITFGVCPSYYASAK
jgi:hypothetical protein